MKYKVHFRIHKPTHTLVMVMEDKDIDWVTILFNELKAKSFKNALLEEINAVESGKKKEGFFSNEQFEFKITPEWVYWGQDLLQDYDTSSAKPIELSEFKKLLEVWWNKYVETEGEPEV